MSIPQAITRIAIDIETAPLPDAADHFDESDVKVGNLKDEAKIKAKVEEARKEFTDKAALNWRTGQVTCICLVNDEISFGIGYHQPGFESEADILESFWQQWRQYHQIITYNGYAFDMQYVIMRSLVHGINCPAIRARGSKYIRCFDTTEHIDLINLFDSCGTWQGLSKVCQTLLGEEKTGDGCQALSLFANKEYQALADYCMHDAELTWRLYKLIAGE